MANRYWYTVNLSLILATVTQQLFQPQFVQLQSLWSILLCLLEFIRYQRSSNSGLLITTTILDTVGSYVDFEFNMNELERKSYYCAGSFNDGDTNRTISNTYDLSDNAAGISSTYTAKLEVLSNHTNAPFASADYSIVVEPEVRSIFTGSAAVQSDRVGDDSRTLYDGTDLNGNDRRIGRFVNSSPWNDYVYAYGDGSSNDVVTGNDVEGGTSTPIGLSWVSLVQRQLL